MRPDGSPVLTKDQELLPADAQGPNLDDLHKWWLEYG
jgi:hypothetical protein